MTRFATHEHIIELNVSVGTQQHTTKKTKYTIKDIIEKKETKNQYMTRFATHEHIIELNVPVSPQQYTIFNSNEEDKKR